MTEGATDGRDHDLNRLAAYVDDRLEPAERESVAAHLAACRDCRAVLAEMGRGLAASPARAGWHVWRPGPLVLPIAAVLVLSALTSVLLLRRPASPLVPGELDRPSPSAEASATPSGESAVPLSPASLPPARETPKAAETAGTDEGLLVKRGGGERSVAGKTFRLVAGEWVDSAFDPTAALPRVETAGPGERDALLARVPGLAPYAALGERVLVVHAGTVYRLRPAAP